MGSGTLVLVVASALIRMPQGLRDGPAAVRNAYIGEVWLKLEDNYEAVEAADDKSLLSVY